MTALYVLFAMGVCGLLLGAAMLRSAVRSVLDEEQLYH
jgi:hypothetical protein